MVDDVIDYAKKQNFPAPNAHSPNRDSLFKRDLAMVNFKSERRSFMDEAAFCGSIVPVPYTKHHESVDPHTRSPKYRNKIKIDYDQATFLKNGDNATKSISP